MRTIKYLFFAYLALIVLVIGAYGVARSFAPARDSDTLFSVYTVSIRSLEASQIYDTTSADIGGHIYETLYNYRYGEKPDDIFPQIAADFPAISADGLTYTFPLRRGVCFYDPRHEVWRDGVGPEVTASDVVFSWKRLADFNVAAPSYSSLLQDNIVGLDDFRAATEQAGPGHTDYDLPVAGLVAVDDHTLRVTLTHAIPNFLQLIASVPTAVVSRASIEKYGTLREHPIGTGPYAVEEYKTEQRIVLIANPIYRGRPDVDGEGGKRLPAEQRLPKIKRVQLDYAQEMLPIWFWFLRGRYDSIAPPKETFAAAVSEQHTVAPDLAARGIGLQIQPQLGLYYIQFNMTDPVIGRNQPLREAMSLAIDRDAFIRIYRNGRGTPATSIIPPDAPLYDEKHASPWAHLDLEAAKAKLKQAEAIQGGPIPVLHLDMGETDTEARQYAEFFTQQWSHIGLRVEPVYNTYAHFLEKMDAKNYQITYTGWSPDYPDEKTYLRLFDATLAAPPGSNTSGYSDPTYQKILEEALAMPRSPARDERYLKLRDMIDEQLPEIPVFYPMTYTLRYDWVGNAKTPYFTAGFYAYYTLDAAKRRVALAGH